MSEGTGAMMTPAMMALADLVKRDGAQSLLAEASVDTGVSAITGSLGVLRWLMDRCAPAQGEGAALIERIATLHERDARGEVIAAEEWRSLRMVILKAVDTMEGEQRALAQVAEAAAWPATGASSLLVDVFGAVVALLHLRQRATLGWTLTDQQRADDHLRAIHEELAQESTPVDRRRIPVLFAARQPELERRFVEQLEAANATYAALAGETLAQIRLALQAPR